MVLDSFMGEIKGFCKNDDTCLFIILVLLGFLLCMFLNRNEGFLDFGDLNGDEKPHNFGNPEEDSGRIGKEPTPLGIQVKKQDPKNGFGPVIGPKYAQAQKGKQYQMRGFDQPGGINRINSSFPMGYDFGARGGYYFIDGQPSEFGRDRPLSSQPQRQVEPSVQAQVTVEPSQDVGGVTQGKGQQMKLVLFYAPWCGHSKTMLDDYDSVINSHHGTTLNNYDLEIIKIDMDSNPEAAKEYGVEVKGFPTLYTFTDVGGKLMGQIFNFRKKDQIIQELEKRTSQMS